MATSLRVVTIGVVAGLFGALAAGGVVALAGGTASAQPAAPAPVSASVPAPAAAATAAAPIAVVDVYRISAKLVSTDFYNKKMEAKRIELKGRIDPMEKELRDMADRLKAMGPDNKSPEAEGIARGFQAKQQDYVKLSQGLDREMETFVTATNFEAFQAVVKEAQVIGKAKGYAYVMSSRALEDAEAPRSAPAFLQAIMARPVLLAPAGVDITNDVIKSLKLEAVEVPGPVGVPAPAPAGAPAGAPAAGGPAPAATPAGGK